MKIPVAAIKIRKRIRRDNGDVNGLAASMSKFGQLHPVVITDKKLIVSGYRRLLAAKALGWEYIDAVIINNKSKKDLLELEIDENLYRKALSEDEVNDAFTRLDRLRNPGFLMRIWNALCKFFRTLFGIRSSD